VKCEIANQPSSGAGFQPVWQKKIGLALQSALLDIGARRVRMAEK